MIYRYKALCLLFFAPSLYAASEPYRITRGFAQIIASLLIKSQLQVNNNLLVCGKTSLQKDLEVKGKTTLANLKAKTIEAQTIKGTISTAASFTGSLQGEVTGPQTATIVSNATSAAAPNTLVRRDASSSFFTKNVHIDGDINFTSTALGTTYKGAILKDTIPFIHSKGGDSNTFVGSNAGINNSPGGNNTGFGYQALTQNTLGAFNTAVGMQALQANTQGDGNTAQGYNALNSTTGSYNSAFGFMALKSNTSGVYNSAYGAGNFPDLTIGSYNLALGFNCGTTLSSGNNNIYIQSNAESADETGVIRIGNPAPSGPGTQQTCYIAGIYPIHLSPSQSLPVLISPTGQLGVNVSPKSLLDTTQDLTDETENLMNLHPVSFMHKSDSTHQKQYGLIADEVAKLYPELVVHTKNGEPSAVNYIALIPLLIKHIQKQQEHINFLLQAQGAS